jgi:hypothetical protein
MGVGKSTEIAAAQQALFEDRFAFRIGIDLTFDMRRIEAGEIFTHILTKFLAARPNPNVSVMLDVAGDLLGGENRDFRRDLARKALRAAGNVALLVDGLEKADEAGARAVVEELFGLSDDADIVLVVPTSLAYGPGAAILAEDVRLFPVRPVLVWGSPPEDVIRGKLFLREVALRHLSRERLEPTGVVCGGASSGSTPRSPDATLLEIVDQASVACGGIPRVLLQLLRDAHRHAVVAKRSMPILQDLERAKRDHGEQLRRSLMPGDVEALVKAEGQDGGEVPLERKLRFLLHGHLLEYKRGDRIVMHVAPTLARALRLPQDLA